MFSGSITALVSPMFNNGDIDLESFKNHIEFQLKSGTRAVVVNGSTGEAPTLLKDEQQALLEAAIKIVNHRVPVIAGTGSNSTHHTIENTKIALELGADACLVVTPYYNRPTQQGLYEHYKKIADSVPIPLILYNVPTRTGCDLLPVTIRKLAEIANIVGLKECMFTLPRIEELVYYCSDKIDLFSGNDEDALGAMLLGFKGVISVVSNVVPQLMSEMCECALSGDISLARKINQQLVPLFHTIFSEANPIGVKWLLSEMGFIKPGIRLPLTPLSEKFQQALRLAFTGISKHI